MKELWHSPRIQLHFGSVVRAGEFVYLSSGHSGPAFMTAVELKTGRIAWQTRDFSKAQILQADGKLIILDEDGTLGLASATPTASRSLARPAAQADRLDGTDAGRHAPLPARPGGDHGAGVGRAPASQAEGREVAL